MMDKDNFFKPESGAGKLSRPKKDALTDVTAKGIISAEAKARAEKTEHLRRLRLMGERSATED